MTTGSQQPDRKRRTVTIRNTTIGVEYNLSEKTFLFIAEREVVVE